MKKTSKRILDIFLRYGILVLIALPNLWLFYSVFTPLTAYPVYFFLNLFFDASLLGNIIRISGLNLIIELIRACIAGSAYYLLLILNLSVQNVKLKKRLKMIFLAFLAFLIINILRIFILSVLYINGFSWFDLAHKLFWYAGSVVFIIVIWFAEVKFFKIKEIPFKEDLKFFYDKSGLGRQRK